MHIIFVINHLRHAVHLLSPASILAHTIDPINPVVTPQVIGIKNTNHTNNHSLTH